MNSTHHYPLYQQAAQQYGADIARFSAGYERDPARRRELLQEVHLALWQSFGHYKGDCSLRTWVYRVAHNVGVNHVQHHLRQAERHYLTLDDVEDMAGDSTELDQTERRLDLAKVMALIHQLAPLDRQVMLLYLEDMDAAGIADVTGLSARNVATKVHRLKTVLARQLGMERKTA